MDKIKPCPFCGAKEIAVLKDTSLLFGEDFTRYHVICKNCAAQIFRGEREEAIDAWNMRVEPKER